MRDYGVDGQIGLEESPEAYVSKLVAVFHEVKRVLKDEGTLWLNLGDSYASLLRTGRKESPGVGAKQEMEKVHTNVKWHAGDGSKFQWTLPGGQKPKDLIGIPWAVAFALRADGWYLRQDIIWSKNNCMPESVTDRCTKSHEYLFLFAKSQRYYFDSDAIKEASVSDHPSGNGFKRPARVSYQNPDGTARGNEEQWRGVGGKRNKRSVWQVNTVPYREAHFATFPPALIEPCILAGTSEKGYCPKCGKAWERQVGKQTIYLSNAAKAGTTALAGKGHTSSQVRENHDIRLGPCTQTETIGWIPSCSCSCDPVPAVVIDPFFGAGTTGLVAKKLGRHYIGIELNEAYIGMAQKRIAAVPNRLDNWM